MTNTLHTIQTIPAAAPPAEAAEAMSGPGGGQLGAVLEALTGHSPVLATIYLLARLLIPALLITIITCGAPAEQRIALLRDYLITGGTHRGRR